MKLSVLGAQRTKDSKGDHLANSVGKNRQRQRNLSAPPQLFGNIPMLHGALALVLGMAGAGGRPRIRAVPAMQLPPAEVAVTPQEPLHAARVAEEGRPLSEQQRAQTGEAEYMGAGSFSSPQAVDAWLLAHGLDTAASGWGQAGTKSVDNLFTELELGETELEAFGRAGEAPGVRRRCTVVKVGVSRPGVPEEVLVEKEQVFADGTRRKRGRPLSEKVLPEEAPLDAARRGVAEELGPVLGGADGTVSIEVEEDDLERWVEIQNSRSYPSLPTRYMLYSVTATVDHLPAGPFTTLEICAEAAAKAAASQLQSRRRLRPPKKASKRQRAEAAAQQPTRQPQTQMQQQPRTAADDGAPLMEPLSVSGRPLLLPDQLLHVWEWVPAAQLLAGHTWRVGEAALAFSSRRGEEGAGALSSALSSKQDEAARALEELGFDVGDFDLDAAFDERFLFDDESFAYDESFAEDATDGTRAAAMSEDTGGCVMYVCPEGRYRVVCSNDDLEDGEDRSSRRRRRRGFGA